MNLKKGNTITIYCKPETLEQIEKLVFAVNDNIRKIYKSDGTGDIINDNGTLIITLTQQETLTLTTNRAKCEIAILTTNGERIGSEIIISNVLDTIIKEDITDEPIPSM